MKTRPKSITVFAVAMIAIGMIGVVVNGYAYMIGHPAYPRDFWLLFAGLKALGIVGGALLIQMLRIGVWWSLASFALGVPVALLATGNVPAWQWAGAALLAALILGAGWLAIHSHWNELRPLGRKLGAK